MPPLCRSCWKSPPAHLSRKNSKRSAATTPHGLGRWWRSWDPDALYINTESMMRRPRLAWLETTKQEPRRDHPGDAHGTRWVILPEIVAWLLVAWGGTQ